MSEINVEAIKKYNEALRVYKEKSAKLMTQIEYEEERLDKLCQELSKELGMQVTPDNIQEVYQSRVDKINNTLAVGNDILQQIRAEEARLQAGDGIDSEEQAANLSQQNQSIQYPVTQVSMAELGQGMQGTPGIPGAQGMQGTPGTPVVQGTPAQTPVMQTQSPFDTEQTFGPQDGASMGIAIGTPLQQQFGVSDIQAAQNIFISSQQAQIGEVAPNVLNDLPPIFQNFK